MSGATWIGVMGVAFVTQLAVLPGEQVQLIVAGLSTRFHPLLVVSAAGAAFAGWTAVEVVVGRALTRALPVGVLDGFTAVMFLLFAGLLVRSAPGPGGTPERRPERPATDGGDSSPSSIEESSDATGEPEPVTAERKRDRGRLDVSVPVLGWSVPSYFGGFLPVFALMAAGEVGDKTQLVTFALASQYPAHPTAIWTGEMLAVVPVTLANALFFYRFSHRVDLRKAHVAGAVIFLFFAADVLLQLTAGFSVWERVVGALVGAGAPA